METKDGFIITEGWSDHVLKTVAGLIVDAKNNKAKCQDDKCREKYQKKIDARTAELKRVKEKYKNK